MKDRRIKERRSWDGNPRCEPGVDTWFEERRKPVIKAGRRTGIVGEYYNPSHLIWEQKNRKERK